MPYHEFGILSLWRRPPRHEDAGHRGGQSGPALRVIRALERIVIDHGMEFTSKALSADVSLGIGRVTRVVDEVIADHGRPESLRSDILNVARGSKTRVWINSISVNCLSTPGNALLTVVGSLTCPPKCVTSPCQTSRPRPNHQRPGTRIDNRRVGYYHVDEQQSRGHRRAFRCRTLRH